MTAAAFTTGCDLVDIARLDRALQRRAGLLERLFTAREIADARRGEVAVGGEVERSRLAARFAAKEATRKALGDLRLPLRDVEVRRAADGAPHLRVRGVASPLSCSLSHDGGVAMAVVVGLVDVADRSAPPHDPSGPPTATAPSGPSSATTTPASATAASATAASATVPSAP